MVQASSSSGLLTLFVALLALGFSVSAVTISLESSSSWCMFMPPAAGDNIADYETTAVPFCTAGALATVPGAKTFPAGLIQSANYLKNGTSYVQITGSLNPAAYFNVSDGGGQFDSDGSPIGAMCTGYKYFINIIEPSNSRFCIRCCNSRTGNANITNACLFDHSSDGCGVVVPNGNYTGQTIPGGSSVPVGSSTGIPSTSLPLSSTVPTLSSTASALNSSASSLPTSASASASSNTSDSATGTTPAAATTLSNTATSITVSTLTVFFCIAGFAVMLL